MTKTAGGSSRKAARAGRFSPRTLSQLRVARRLRIRAGGGDHDFTGIWFVLVDGRLFVRPWNDKPGGWHRAFRREPEGVIAIGDQEIRVRARAARGERLFDAVDRAYAAKYDTKASLPYARGFARDRRRKTTTELRPR